MSVNLNTKIALIMNENSYPGREYLSKILEKNLVVDVIIIGNFHETNEIEEIRCGGLWKPLQMENFKGRFLFFKFLSLTDYNLIEFLKDKKYTIGIQGGTGIFKYEIIKLFSVGILNFHPGDLPLFRGCSAPEWQLYENKKVISTCHFIDHGIDSGDILIKKELEVSLTSYESFRSSIYPQTSKFMVEVLQKIILDLDFVNHSYSQNEKMAIYRKYIGDERILELKKKLIGFKKKAD